jgi:type VI secretion system protein ImpE
MSEYHSTVETLANGHLASGDLGATRRLLSEGLRTRPDDQRARMFLFQLLCIDGEWDKARVQAQALAQLSPEAQMLSVAYGQVIDGELARAAAGRGAEPAALLHASPEWLVELATVFAADGEAAASRRARAFDGSPDMPGDVDGRRFDFLFDGDGRFGPAFEAIIAGRWGLIPFTAVEEIASEGPVDLRDLVWLPAEIRFREGGSAAALLPARYPGTEQAPDAELRLARRTEWRESGDMVRGTGQRIWTTSAGEDVGILSFRRIRFAPLP